MNTEKTNDKIKHIRQDKSSHSPMRMIKFKERLITYSKGKDIVIKKNKNTFEIYDPTMGYVIQFLPKLRNF